MKKLIFFAVILAVFSAACRKDYTCTCRNPASGSYSTNTTIVSAKSYQKDAQTWCTGFQTMPNVPPQTTCILK